MDSGSSSFKKKLCNQGDEIRGTTETCGKILGDEMTNIFYKYIKSRKLDNIKSLKGETQIAIHTLPTPKIQIFETVNPNSKFTDR